MQQRYIRMAWMGAVSVIRREGSLLKLPVKRNLGVGEQDFILANRAHVVLAGHVLGQQDGAHAGHPPGEVGVAAENARLCVRRTAPGGGNT